MPDAPISRSAVLEILRTPAASDTFPDMIRRVEALEGSCVRVKALEDFVADFASAKIDALRYQPAYGESPEDEPDPVVDAETVWAWQADAKTSLAAPPVAQPETPTPGQFTTMCLAIEDVVTGRGFDVAIPEEVKAYMRNALMVGGWRGERD